MRVMENASLAKLTTIGLGGSCKACLVLESPADLGTLSAALEQIGATPYALGLGSNILAFEGWHDVVLVRPALKGDPVITSEEGGRVQVSCLSGLPLPAFLAFCGEKGLSGLEGLAGIPGSMGGAIAMNAGSFGATIGDCVVSVDIWCDGQVKTYASDQLSLAYRHFAPQGLEGRFYLVTGCTLALEQADPALVREKIAATRALKKERQPVGARSAGCVFQNPASGQSAGILLDQAGFRGRKLGGMQFSPVHANFLVNTGRGTAREAKELLEEAKAAVLEQFGIELSLEVRSIPCHCL